MTIGVRIKSLRKEHQITQFQLGEIAGIHGSNISRIEQDKAIPSGETILKISNYFNVSCDYILGRSQEYNDFIVGYILNNDGIIQLVDCSTDGQINTFKQLFQIYIQLNTRNREELLEFIKMKVRFQNQQ